MCLKKNTILWNLQCFQPETSVHVPLWTTTGNPTQVLSFMDMKIHIQKMTESNLDLELSGTDIEATLLRASEHWQGLLCCLPKSPVSFQTVLSFKSEMALIPRERNAGQALYSAPSVRCSETVKLMLKISLPLLTEWIYNFNICFQFFIFFSCMFDTSSPQNLLMVIC